MSTRTIPCRVCGKMFVPCNKTSGVLGAFNYHEVACSPECGAEYLRRVQAAREKPSNAPSIATPTVDKMASPEESAPKRGRGRRRGINPVDEYKGES